MKVLHVAPALGPELGGPSEVIVETVRELRAMRIDAEIATTCAGLPEYASTEGTLQDYRDVPVRFFRPGAVSLRQYIPSPGLAEWLGSSMGNYSIADLHYLFTYSTATAAKACARSKTPYVVRSMGQLTEWSLAQSTWRKRLHAFWYDRPIMNRASAIICTADAETDDVRRFGVRTPCVVNPLGVRLREPVKDARAALRMRYVLPSNALIILFLSRLHPKKQPHLLIDLLGRGVPPRQPVQLILAGDGDRSYVESLKQRAWDLGVLERVSFPGFLSGREKDQHLQGSDLFVLPTLSENFGLAIAEACAAGLPVLTTNAVQTAAQLEAAGAAEIVAPDFQSISSAAAKLLRDPARRAALSEQARKFVAASWSWRGSAEQLLAEYQNIISKS